MNHYATGAKAAIEAEVETEYRREIEAEARRRYAAVEDSIKARRDSLSEDVGKALADDPSQRWSTVVSVEASRVAATAPRGKRRRKK
ncbi:MAG TPA: hypothetical protein VFW33_08270, partial [Gemmataceae bacterium]|nr:hypothetical protein [Gemmataceae bacterium]